MSRSILVLFGFIVLLLLGSSLIPTILVSNGASSSTRSGYWLHTSVHFNAFGQFYVNSSLIETTNSSSGLNSVTFGFPKPYTSHIVRVTANVSQGSNHYQASVSASTGTNGTVLMSLSFSPGLQAGQNASVNLGFYVINSFVATNSTNYNAPVLLYPSVSTSVDRVVTSITLPYLTTHVADSTLLQKAGFSHTVGTNASYESWDFAGTNVSTDNPSWKNVSIYSDSTDSGSLDFTYASRALSVDSSGNIVVEDTLTILNNGQNTVTLLPFSILTSSTNVTVVPAAEPPLSNVKTTTLSAGELDLNAIGKAVEPNSAETIILQYPLGKQYWNYSGGVYNVHIPTSTAVNAFVDHFQITSSVASGIIVTNNMPPVNSVNGSSIPRSVEMSYRMGIGSAYGSVLPIAGMVFIAVFVAGLIFRPKMEEGEDSGLAFDMLVKAIEEKVSGTNDILSELKSKGSSASRNDLVTARSRIEEFRTKSAARFATLRSQLPSAGTTVQAGLNDVISNDREFDRAVKDVLNNYEQFISKRMKEDTFLRLKQNNERRMQHATNTLLDSVHDVREEFESEG